MVSVMATTGSNLFKGDQTISGSVIPAVNSIYDLGSPTKNFRHLYLSSASLYIDGTKVLGSTTQELQITTDAGQSFKILEAGSDTITLQAADGNITLATSGGGDVILDPTTGIIALKGTTTVYAGNKILSSDGNAIQFGNSVTMTGSLVVTGFIETQELRTTYISSSILYRSGSTKFGDELTDTHSFTGSLSVSGSISVPGSNLVSGSAQVVSLLPSGTISGSVQILNGSGVWSGSAQLPSGVVSGSSQVLAGTTIHSGSFFNGISVVSGSGQISYTGITNIPSGIISGSAQLPSGTVSGSVQVDVMSTTNIARLATTGSNTFNGTQLWGYGRLTSGYNSSGQITINASYDGGQTNTYTPDYAGSTAAGMFVMKQRNGGEGNFDFYGKNHQTTGGSHALSTFNIIMGMNTNGSVAIGKLNANAPLDVNGNTLVTGSITSTGNISAGTTFNWNGGIGALSYGSGFVTMETNTANAIQLKTNGTTAITINTGQTVNFSTSIGIRTSVFGEYLNIGNGGAIAWQNTSSSQKWHIQYNTANDGLNFVESAVADYRLFLKAGGGIGVNKSNPSGTFDVQSAGANGIILSTDSNDSNNSGRIFLMRTGGEGWTIMNNAGNLSFRSNGVPGSTSGNERMRMDSSYNLTLNNGLSVAGTTTLSSTTNVGGNLLPTSDAAYNLGSTSLRWANLYTTDLHLSNAGSQNIVDGTWGDWTLQEGENDIYMLNNRSGEKFKIKLEKI